MKFPVFSLLTGNFETETSSHVTAPSSGESATNRAAPSPRLVGNAHPLCPTRDASPPPARRLLLINASLVIGNFARTGWMGYPPLSELGFSTGALGCGHRWNAPIQPPCRHAV